MTVQIAAPYKYGASKKALSDALNGDNTGLVNFYDPSIVNPRYFTGREIRIGERFPIVMDPETRRRFAEIVRKPDGTFRVL